MSHHLYIEVLQRPAMLVSGWPVLATIDALPSAMPAAWERVCASLPTPPEGYAEASVALEDGRSHEVVGVLVGPAERAPGPVTVRLPAGTYLHTRYEGPLEGIADAFATLMANAAGLDYRVGTHRLDVGYTSTVRDPHRTDGLHEAHDLWVEVHPLGDEPAM